MTPKFMQPNLPTKQEIECEICYLQHRIANKDGMPNVLEYRLQQLHALLEDWNG